jgi:large subunit ribosomal protein L4
VSALSLRAKEQRLLVVESFELEAIGTKQLAQVLAILEVEGGLLVDVKANDKLRLSARNLKDHDFLPPEGLNVYDVLRHPNLVMTRDAALKVERSLTGTQGEAS